jgi:hypothetical protein
MGSDHFGNLDLDGMTNLFVRETEYEFVYLIDRFQYRVQWWAVEAMGMNLRKP